jgi:hypothetical protein
LRFPQTASSWAESFDALLDAYQTISANMPILEDYQAQFRDDKSIQDVMVAIWGTILEFHIRAMRIFDQHRMSSPLSSPQFRSSSMQQDTKTLHLLLGM